MRLSHFRFLGGKRQGPRMYECVKIHSNTLHEDSFPATYLHLQESTSDGRNLLHDAYMVCARDDVLK